ncbi:hypothetical protein BDW22DRAFT_662767 [Trametopsis cervina]|nr:hypothetical protein BDW22DRAFT_662767 [Trametopsis cervina]
MSASLLQRDSLTGTADACSWAPCWLTVSTVPTKSSRGRNLIPNRLAAIQEPHSAADIICSQATCVRFELTLLSAPSGSLLSCYVFYKVPPPHQQPLTQRVVSDPAQCSPDVPRTFKLLAHCVKAHTRVLTPRLADPSKHYHPQPEACDRTRTSPNRTSASLCGEILRVC